MTPKLKIWQMRTYAVFTSRLPNGVCLIVSILDLTRIADSKNYEFRKTKLGRKDQIEILQKSKCARLYVACNVFEKPLFF
jgi:hypothetical protein